MTAPADVEAFATELLAWLDRFYETRRLAIVEKAQQLYEQHTREMRRKAELFEPMRQALKIEEENHFSVSGDDETLQHCFCGNGLPCEPGDRVKDLLARADEIEKGAR
jgi:hypothetical protein